MYDNENTIFFNRIAGLRAPLGFELNEASLDWLASIFHCLYGILILIIGQENKIIELNPDTSRKVRTYAREVAASGNIDDKITIIPFPKKE